MNRYEIAKQLLLTEYKADTDYALSRYDFEMFEDYIISFTATLVDNREITESQSDTMQAILVDMREEQYGLDYNECGYAQYK